MTTKSASWLGRLKKTELAELADDAGMDNYKNLNKTDLSDEIERFLRNNQTTLQERPKLAEFYKRVQSGSPAATGRELVKSDTKTPSKPRRKTVTPKEKEDPVSEAETPGAAQAIANTLRTPAARLSAASQIPLPPSPAVVAQEVERQTARATAWFGEIYESTGVRKQVEWARDQASTSQAVTTLSVALEAIVLLSVLLPQKYLGVATPAIPALGLQAYNLKGPQFWNLLELQFWATTTLWSGVSVILPAIVAYLFNLPLKAKRHGKSHVASFDPFLFNVAKGLFTWLVFIYGVDLPTLALSASRLHIEFAVPGGHLWLLVSSILGALVSLYEAVLRH